jgi:hypothetical protein
MTMRNVKVSDTRQPTLTRAVIRATGRENLEDIARHGVSGGFAGFIYTADCVRFFRRHRKAIQQRLQEDAIDFGVDPLNMVTNFNCLKGAVNVDDVGRALYGNSGEMCDTIQNALAWYAAEEIAREMNPEI